MKSITSLCLTSLLIASANAATYNAQGKIINSKDAKNPGIVSYEKAVAKKQNSIKSTKMLAKTYSDDKVEKLWGLFDSDDNTFKLNGYKQTEQRYFELIEKKEKADKNRSSYTGLNSENKAAPYPSVSQKNCSIGYKNPNLEDFYDTHYFGLRDYFSMPTNNKIGQSCTDNYLGDFRDMCGKGITIYNVVGDKKLNISADNSNCQDNSFTRNYTLGIQHYYAYRFLSLLSPKANIDNYINEGDARINKKFAMLPNNPFEKGIHIGNIIATSTKNVSTYNDEAAELDDYIYHNRVIEFAPFTENGQRTGAGIALNAISVAGASSDQTILRKNTAVKPRFIPSKTSEYNKPEIYSISYIHDAKTTYGGAIDFDDKQITHNGYDIDFLAISDSWGATTTAAAMTADLLSKYPFYKWHPEVVKALLITANNRSPIDEANYKDIYEYAQRTTPYKLITIKDKHMPSIHQMLKGNRSRFFYGNNSDFFINDKYSFAEKVEPGKKYNIAIAWLVRGDYAREKQHLSSNYTMEIYINKTNTLLAKAPTDLATYRYIELDVPSGVTEISVRITRTRNEANDRIILGYNLHRIQD